MKGKRRGTFFLAGGALLLAASLCLTGYNLWDERRAGAASDEVMEALSAAVGRVVPAEKPDAVFLPETRIPDYILDPGMEMPTVEIEGETYVGWLELPTLELTLPVMSEWSYPRLRLAPCRYAGSVYQGDMVIAAHNYARHFGRLRELTVGDPVAFTDVDGDRFTYTVVEVGQLDPYAAEAMRTGDWDLTLFTCTIGGQYRVTVRCVRDV